MSKVGNIGRDAFRLGHGHDELREKDHGFSRVIIRPQDPKSMTLARRNSFFVESNTTCKGHF